MSVQLDFALEQFKPSDLTVKLCNALLAVLPGSSPLAAYSSVAAALPVVFGDLPPEVLTRANTFAGSKDIRDVLKVAKGIDTGDTGLAVYSGVRSALNLFFGKKKKEGEEAPDAPPPAELAQQRTDAALKVLALSYALRRLFPDMRNQDRLAALTELPAGLALLRYFGCVEVALPFSDELLAAEPGFVERLVATQDRTIAGKLASLVGAREAKEAAEDAEDLEALLEEHARKAAPHVDTIANALRSHLPKVVGKATDNLPAFAAGAADALPSYRFLLARLGAEACLWRAREEICPPDRTPPPEPEAAEQEASPAPAADPFAAPAPAAAADPFALPADPFARPTASPAPAPAPAPTPAAGPTAYDPFAAAPKPPPPPPPEPLQGRFVHEADGRSFWLCFEEGGVFSPVLPAEVGAVDWAARAASGHPVARFRAEGATLYLSWPDGRENTASLEVGERSVTLDGREARRADWDLSGRSFEGTWAGPDGVWAFTRAGEARLGDREGRYTLGPCLLRLVWSDGAIDERSLHTTLAPKARAPDVLWIGGAAARRS
jgi:hypothetical protein